MAQAGGVVPHRPKLADKLVSIFRRHVHNVGNVPQISDIEETVVSRAIIATQSRAIHAQGDV